MTHAAIAASGVSMILGTADPLPLGLAVLGSQLPDIDTTTSFIGQIFYPVSSWIEDRFPHRSVTHSLLATAVLAAISFFCGYSLSIEWKVWAALPLGHLLSSFSDTFTRQGVQLFWPEPAWCISVSNPKRRLVTGGPGEYWVLAVAIMLLVVSINVNSTGSIASSVGTTLGLRDEVTRQYNAIANTNHVWLNVKGYKLGDRTAIDDRFFTIDRVGNEFVVTDGEAVYVTRQQIEVEKLSLVEGDRAVVTTETLNFNDEPAAEKLQNLLYPQTKSWTTGELAIEFGDEILLQPNPLQHQTVSLMGNVLTFDRCPLEKAIELLGDQYGKGTLIVKSVTPNPFGSHS
ncbi:metal-dependent hydrolase [Baaleninema sp.]|uniref:metal-dependent hydrolase n=1 Tax=Baaleninema sp. TaxID=3101197 RepID=UPI003CFBD230